MDNTAGMQRNTRQPQLRGSMAINFPSSNLPVRAARGPWDPFSQTPSPSGGRPSSSSSSRQGLGTLNLGQRVDPATRNSPSRQWASSISRWPSHIPDQAAASTSSEWSFFGFSATISNLQQLSDDLEHTSAVPGRARSPTVDITRSASAHGSFEVLSHSFAGKFKCDIFKSPTLPWASHDSAQGADPLSASSHGQKHLSLYLSCHMNDTDPMGDACIPASIHIALRDSKQESAAPIWELWQAHTFGDTSDYMECTFPLPSTLLQNLKVRHSDSVILTVQVQSPASASSARRASPLNIPQFPSARLAPKSLLNGLLDMLDCPHTSDVEITVFERSTPTEASDAEADLGTTLPEAGLGATEEQPTMYRRRTFFAHSAILRARSSYFDAMLGGTDWNESATEANGKRRHRVTLDFDYVAVYWLLRFLYTDQITFDENDITRNLPRNEPTTIPVDQLTASWQRLDQITALHDSNDSEIPPRRSASDPVSSHATSYYRRADPVSFSHSSLTSRVAPDQTPSAAPTASTAERPRSDTAEDASAAVDQHPHPFTVETPASAIAIYQIAHAYGLTSLARLSLDHIVDNLSPSTAFPLLLWTHLYSELHNSIKIYAYRNWYDIVHSESYRACMDEVAAGLWPSSGEVLYELTRSLAPSMSTL